MNWADNFRRGLADYFQERIGLFVFLAAVLVAGIVAGALVAKGMGDFNRTELVTYFEEFVQNLNDSRIAPGSTEILRWSLAQNLKTAAILWILGVTVVGFPGVLAVIFLRGFTLGFSVAFLVGELGLKGILVSLLALIPQATFTIPAFLIQGVAALSFSLMLFRNRFQRERIAFYQELAGYTLLVVSSSLLLIGATLLDTFAVPIFIRLASGNL